MVPWRNLVVNTEKARTITAYFGKGKRRNNNLGDNAVEPLRADPLVLVPSLCWRRISRKKSLGAVLQHLMSHLERSFRFSGKRKMPTL